VLPVWLGGLLLAVAWLRDLRTFGDPAFTAARAFALTCAGYLVVATVVNVALAACRVRVRLPLVPLLVLASLTTPLAVTPAFASAPPPVMHRIDAPVPPVAPTPTATTAAAAPTAPAAAPAPPMWKVKHGECFWSIARQVMHARLGRAPTNAEIAAYWRPLIELNRPRLSRPSDPGLLFAGQELLLPA
jgi:hypothetical protein